MTFVNIHGQPIDIAALATKKVSKVKMPTTSVHKGFQPMGYSQEQISEARRKHESDSRLETQAGRPPLEPFSIDGFLRKAKPKKIGKPLSSHDAANVAASLAEKGGWVRVHVVELKKGGTA